MHNNLTVRYGSDFNIKVTIDDDQAVSADIYVGNEGEAYVITSSANFVEGIADISLDGTDTSVPLGDYKYQINVNYLDGKVKKYPVDNCGGNELPVFSVLEALDEIEVS